MVLSVAGCGPAMGPRLDHVGSTTGAVGVEFQLTLHTTPPSGNTSFDFDAPDLPDLKKRKLPASITSYARGQAIFRWMPLAGDEGEHEIVFIAHNANGESRTPITLTITPGEDGEPVFLEPVGEGTTLSLDSSDCAEISVVVHDADQANVEITLLPPPIANMELEQTGPHEATLMFCPKADQIATSTVFVVTMVADDGTYHTIKTYTLIVRPPGTGCTSEPPDVEVNVHGDSYTLGNLHIKATIEDDVGVLAARVYWTTTAPFDPHHPDLLAFSPVTMSRKSGDARSGLYEAILPNPVVSLPPESRVTIYYVVVAQDDDPPLGCAHQVIAPENDVLSFVVRRPAS